MTRLGNYAKILGAHFQSFPKGVDYNLRLHLFSNKKIITKLQLTNLNEHNVLYDQSPINIEGVVDMRIQQWLMVCQRFLCRCIGTSCS